MTDERLLIDRNSLDQELIENPELVQSVGDELAEAIAIRDTLKEALDSIDAELDVYVREDAERAKKKITEAMVATAIILNPRHKHAFEAYNEAKLKAAKAASLERAVSSRSDALRLLSDLYKVGYFAINSARETPSTREVQYEMQRKKIALSRASRLVRKTETEETEER